MSRPGRNSGFVATGSRMAAETVFDCGATWCNKQILRFRHGAVKRIFHVVLPPGTSHSSWIRGKKREETPWDDPICAPPTVNDTVCGTAKMRMRRLTLLRKQQNRFHHFF